MPYGVTTIGKVMRIVVLEQYQPAHPPPPPLPPGEMAAALADKFAATFKDFPPIQKPNSFTIDDAIAMMKDAAGGGGK